MDKYTPDRVSRAEVLARLGDPSTWEADAAALDEERRRPYPGSGRLRAFLITFLAGFVYEAGCVVWVHASESNDVPLAVGFSCINAIVTMVGVEGFLKSRANKVAYVLGFGAGTFAAMWLRRAGAPS